jgi:site-specific recombinase XerD
MYNCLHLHQLFCDYASTFKNNSPRTIIAYENSFRRFLDLSEIGDVRDISQIAIEQFILEGKKRFDWSPKTIRNHLQYLSSFLDWCVRRNLLEENIVKFIERPKLPKRLPRSLSRQQAMDLILWTRNYNYYYQFERSRATAIIATFIFTGIRLRELYNLELVDIDLKHGKTMLIRQGKGSKDRIIPLNKRLIDILSLYLRKRTALGRETHYFFTALRADK